MGRTRQFKKQKCFNPQCINGGKPADLENKKCFWEKGNFDKVFCSPECGQHYAEHEDEIEEKNRTAQNVRKEKSRQQQKITDRQKKLAHTMFVLLDKKIEEADFVKLVADLAMKLVGILLMASLDLTRKSPSWLRSKMMLPVLCTCELCGARI